MAGKKAVKTKGRNIRTKATASTKGRTAATKGAVKRRGANLGRLVMMGPKKDVNEVRSFLEKNNLNGLKFIQKAIEGGTINNAIPS